MGGAVGDFNLDGNLDILKTHFREDTSVLYANAGKGRFRDVTVRSGLGVETRFVSWDGWRGRRLQPGRQSRHPQNALPRGHVRPLRQRRQGPFSRRNGAFRTGRRDAFRELGWVARSATSTWTAISTSSKRTSARTRPSFTPTPARAVFAT